MAGDPIGQWLRRRFLAGFFVTVPLVISVAALVWIFGIIDGFTAPLATRLAGTCRRLALGILIMLLFVLLVGTVATNVIGRRILATRRAVADAIPVFKTIYCAGEAAGRGVLAGQRVRFQARRDGGGSSAAACVMGFLTKEFTVDRGRGPEALMAVYVPTNHLYLGDIVSVPRERASSRRHRRGRHPDFPDRRDVAAGDRMHSQDLAPVRCALHARGRMRLIDGLLRRAGRLAALLALLAAMLAVPSRALAQQPEPAGAAAAQAERDRRGGEAALVLPDLEQVDVGGYNGRTLLMGGMVVSALGIVVRPGRSSTSSRTCRCTGRCARSPS